MHNRNKYGKSFFHSFSNTEWSLVCCWLCAMYFKFWCFDSIVSCSFIVRGFQNKYHGTCCATSWKIGKLTTIPKIIQHRYAFATSPFRVFNTSNKKKSNRRTVQLNSCTSIFHVRSTRTIILISFYSASIVCISFRSRRFSSVDRVRKLSVWRRKGRNKNASR